MAKKPNLLFFLGMLFVFLLCAAVAAVAYLIGSPAKVKALLEQSISRATGTECSISEFSYTLNPLLIHARGIQVIDHVQWFYLEIPELITELSLQGPFLRKSLVVNHLTLKGFSLNTYHSSSLRESREESASTGFFSRVAKELVGVLLFRDIRIDDAEVSGGHLNSEIGEQILTLGGIHASLNEQQSMQMACYGRMRWRSEEIEVTIPHLRLTADRAISLIDPEIKMSVKGEEMRVSTPLANLENLSGQAEALYDRDKGVLTFNSAHFSSEKLTLKHGDGSSSPLLKIHFEADGFVDLISGKSAAQGFRLVLNEMMEARGNFQAEMGDRPRVTLNSIDLEMNLRNLWPLAPESFGVKPSSFLLGGIAHVTGNLDGVLKGGDWQWGVDLGARMKENPVSIAIPGLQGHGRITADIQVKGFFPDLETTLAFTLDRAAFEWKHLEVESASASFSASGKGLDFALQNLNLQAPHTEIFLLGKRLQALGLKAQFQSGSMDVTQKKINFPKIDVRSSSITNLQLSVDARDGEVFVGLEGKEVKLLSLAKMLNVIPSDWHLEGVDSLSMKGALKKDGRWRLDSQWNCDEFAFQSPDMAQAGEKISLQLGITATGDMIRPGWSASVESSAEKGGFLYDRIYLDLSKHSLLFKAQGEYDIFSATADLSGCKVLLKDLLSFEVKGQLADPTSQKPWHLLVHIPRTPLKPVFQLFLKDPLRQEWPVLAELDLGGDFLAEMEFQKASEGWRLLGHWSWHDGEVLWKSMTLEGIELDLPFWGENIGEFVESPFRSGSAFFSNFKKEGNLSIQSMAFPYLLSQSFAAEVHTSPNKMTFIPRNSIKAAGGEIELGPLVFNELFALSPSFMTNVAFNRVDLAPFLSDLRLQLIPGYLHGKLDTLEFDGHKIHTRGDLALRAYGGEVVFSNLGGSGMVTSTPTFLLDATWKDLNLGQLTEGTPFGKVEGILKGYTKNLEIVCGEPQKFDLFMETVKTKEVPQKISVRAVENIARIGGGASPFIGLAGAFTSIFNEFPYEKIAIQASLENDVFRIDGPIKEGDKVYLVKRSGFSGVNVINQDPDRGISFKDMVKRIKRVTAPRESPPGEEETPKKQELWD